MWQGLVSVRCLHLDMASGQICDRLVARCLTCRDCLLPFFLALRSRVSAIARAFFRNAGASAGS